LIASPVFTLFARCPVNPAVTGFAPVFEFLLLWEARRRDLPIMKRLVVHGKSFHEPGYFTGGAGMQLLPEKTGKVPLS